MCIIVIIFRKDYFVHFFTSLLMEWIKTAQVELIAQFLLLEEQAQRYLSKIYYNFGNLN